MYYVPSGPAKPPSPRVRELSQRIQEVINEFQRQYPLSPSEIRQALRLATGRSGGENRAPLVAVVAGLAVAAGLGVFVMFQRSPGEVNPAIWPAVLVGVGVVALGLVFALRNR
jgi:hypothetical protein